MLVLSRRKNESVMIGDNIEVTVTDFSQGQVKLGFAAPKEVVITRKELYIKKTKEVERD
jgi:carbon storage regulator